jgi:Domain of unknown function (DUF4405)
MRSRSVGSLSARSSKLNKRAFVALVIAIAGIGLVPTGIANHVLQLAPIAGRRHAWMAAHFGLGVLFTIFTAWHIVLNRAAFFRYLQGIAARSSASRREIVWAVAVVASVIAVTAGHTLHAR